jgi:inner membrane protein
MDPLTHAVLGAVASQGFARKHEFGLAALIGFAAAMLPDADTFIQSAQDSLLTLEYHRQFTHALIFIPVGAFIASAVLWFFFRHRVPFVRLYLYAMSAYATAGLLDACTSYGTQLLWPFSTERIAWKIVAIIDPVVTLTLIAAVILAVVRKSRIPAIIGLMLIICYLLLGLSQRNQVEQAAYALAGQRGHPVEKIAVKPSMGSLLLWRSVYLSGGIYYVDAIRAGLLSDIKIYPGGAIKAFDISETFPGLEKSSVLYNDIQRFNTYSSGFLVSHPDIPAVVGDIRYAMLPNGLRPLWGIETNGKQPEKHVKYKDIRVINEDKVNTFLSMLFGH